MLPVQDKKQKLDFQDGRQGGHLGLGTGRILAIFDLQVTQLLPTKFRVNGLSVQEKKRKKNFKRAAILDFQSE